MIRLRELYAQNRTLFWLSTVIFVNQLGFGSVVPVVPLYARAFGVSQAAIGLTIAVYGLARFMINVPTGQLADRIGRRRTLVFGEAVTLVGNLLCGLAGSYEQFLLYRFISGVGASMVVTGGQVILADLSTPTNRGRYMGFYQGMFLFAVNFGPLPGGLLADHFGLNSPFYAFAALGAVAGVVAYDKVPETRGWRGAAASRLSSSPGVRLSVPAQLRVLFARPGFALISFVSFVQFFARTGAVFAVVPVLATTKLGLGPDQIGLGLSIVSVANLGTVYLSGVLVDRFGRKMVIVPTTLLTSLSMALFALAPDYAWFTATMALWGLAGGISGPAPAAYAADMAPPGMNASTMSSFRMIADFGYVTGPLLTGWMADLYGNEATLYATAALFLVSASLFGLFAPETKLPAAVPKRIQPAGEGLSAED